MVNPVCLVTMRWFDIVLGMVPDYIHGCLLGITKTLLKKWFSSTDYKKDFFIGGQVWFLQLLINPVCQFTGAGSCGLNVHNAGAHLVDYVKGWGPLWAWSTFGFEDMNGTLMDFCHGTGNVCRQVNEVLCF